MDIHKIVRGVKVLDTVVELDLFLLLVGWLVGWCPYFIPGFPFCIDSRK